MQHIAGVLAGRLSVRTARVVEFNQDGTILVKAEDDALAIRTRFLRVTREAPPLLHVGDQVLVAVDADAEEGYVLGAVEPYPPQEEAGTRGESEADDGIVDVVLPRNARAVRVSASQIRLEAGDEIQIKCGEGTILIDKRGKIVIRGTDVVSRARRSNKIKGASVAIN